MDSFDLQVFAFVCRISWVEIHPLGFDENPGDLKADNGWVRLNRLIQQFDSAATQYPQPSFTQSSQSKR